MIKAIQEINTECPEKTEQKNNHFWREQQSSDLNLLLQGLGGTKGTLPVRGRTREKEEMGKCVL